jgi:sulfane dehydrogenase subunit SoxC
MSDLIKKIGRIVPAPENFLDQDQLDAARNARRSFMGKALLMGAGVTAAIKAAAAVGEGDPAILKLPEHSTSLGQPVAASGYGMPSKWEKNLQRRESPGLTRVRQSSVSFTPLQGLFGIITPNGLHFERHHQGWHDIDPSQHRLMINGLVKQARVFTMDDLMRLPSASRIHFIECGANTGAEWGNVALPTVQYTHGMLSCSEFTGVLLSTLLELCGYDKTNGKYVLAEGADGSSMTRTIAIDRAMDERRNAAAGKRLSAASGCARRARCELGEISAPHRSRRPTLRHQGRNHPLHRPDARWNPSPIHLSARMQKRDYHAVGWASAAG